MPDLKPDSEKIRSFLAQLADQDWIKRTGRSWWPRFVFHYTDLSNAASILRDGYIYSRHHVEQKGKLTVSSGSSLILASTGSDVKDCVRFYFRPQTPTQYHAEGVKSQEFLSQSTYPDAHCPVPVFFLFDSADILTRDGSWFSDGGLGSTRAKKHLYTAEELESLPWKKIYHIGAFNPSDPSQSDITSRRSAEIVVPKQLDLTNLRYIYCRSEAEKETLLYLLPNNLRRKYQEKIVSTSKYSLFFRQHTFIQTVRLTPTGMDLNFSPETKSPGPFQMRIEVIADGLLYPLERDATNLNGKFPLKFMRSLSEYEVRVKLDSHLIYANSYEDFDLPF